MVRWPSSLTRRMGVLVSLLIICGGVAIALMVRAEVRHTAVDNAASRAEILAAEALAVHTYFSEELKPDVFAMSDEFREPAYFEPSWMSSTYAVRELNVRFRALVPGEYYYKEAAINARSPLNEATGYEAEFLRALNTDPDLVEDERVRTVAGEPQYVLLRKAETITETCLRCHSTPDAAPAGLVAIYGGERSFGRQVGEVASAISVRIPLEAEFARADQLAAKVTLYIIATLVVVLLVMYGFVRQQALVPLARLRSFASGIGEGSVPLGARVQESGPEEFVELAGALNRMSGQLEDQVEEISNQSMNLEEANEQLHSALASRDEFMRNMTHEFRTPLNSIIGFGGTIQSELPGELNEEQRRQVDMIVASGRRLRTMVDELLDFARVASGSHELHITEFDLCAGLSEIVDTLRGMAEEKDIDLVVECDDHDVVMRSDKQKLQAIVLNLGSNAIKFTHSGCITVRVDHDDANVSIGVRDSGEGIAPEHLPHVFEDFYQVSSARLAKPVGSGVGLALSRRYAELLGGELAVESELGVGSTFTLTVPRMLDV